MENECIPKSDIEVLRNTYLQLGEKAKCGLTPLGFIDCLGGRIFYDETVKAPSSSHVSKYHISDEGDKLAIFSHFIQQETHFALQGMGYQWAALSNRFVGLSSGDYQKARREVLVALVRRADDIFARDQESGHITREQIVRAADNRQFLLCNLGSYIDVSKLPSPVT